MRNSSALASGEILDSPVHDRRRKAAITLLLIPPLENGERLEEAEFLRRYEAMPDIKKAELIDGKVYLMTSPVSTLGHAEPDYLMHAWHSHYLIRTPGIGGATNPTLRLGPKNTPQPDSVLYLLPEFGGTVTFDKKGYMMGAPELVVEIANSSASLDVHEKLETYRKAGAREYLVWLTRDETFSWWHWQDGGFNLLSPEPSGVLRSITLPGLWLDTDAMLKRDLSKMMATLSRGIKSAEHGRFVKSFKR